MTISHDDLRRRAARAIVDQIMGGSDAPDEVRDEAVVFALTLRGLIDGFYQTGMLRFSMLVGLSAAMMQLGADVIVDPHNEQEIRDTALRGLLNTCEFLKDGFTDVHRVSPYNVKGERN